MNKIIYYFWICFTFVRLSSANISIEDSIKEIEGKRTLTADYCNNSREQVQFIWGNLLSIYVITPDALWNCKEVLSIFLGYNKLEEIHTDTFKFNTKTSTLYLRCNRISYLPNEIFEPLSNLFALDLSGNPLKNLDSVLNFRFSDLWILYIEAVGLTELNTVVLLEQLPSLRSLNFDGNPIPCNLYDIIRSNLSDLDFNHYISRDMCVDVREKCFVPEPKISNTHVLQVDIIRNVAEKKVTHLLQTIILLAVGFSLITGFLLIKLFQKT